MFRETRRKKLRNRVIYLSLAVIVLTLGIWMNYRTDVQEKTADEPVETVDVDSAKKVDELPEKETSKTERGTDTEIKPETYLIKEVDGVVKVFLCDGEGNKELYLITSIPFDLLSESDQQLFVDGVTIATEDDLGEFLQNFDS